MTEDNPKTDEIAPALAVDGASLAYAGKRALDSVSLSVGAGEVYALVGPNGAGKSSLVKAITGRQPLAAGSIRIGGAAAGTPGARRKIGIAPQRPSLYDRLTARENIVCFARLAGVSAVNANGLAADALALAGFPADDKTPAGKLSGGWRQRLNIAAAIAHRPPLAILDEPAAALDREGVDGVNALIERLAAGGVGVLLVTHDMAQADLLAARVGVLRRGRLIAEDSPAALRGGYGGPGLIVTIIAEGPVESLLAAEGFCESAPRRWRGALANQSAAAALAERLERAGAMVRSVEAAAPTLADAVSALLAREAAQQAAA